MTTSLPTPPQLAPRPALWLASQSPRRGELLTQLGVDYALLLADQDEDAEALESLKPGESPQEYVQRVVRLKLEAAIARALRRSLWTQLAVPAAPILCADTTVCLGDVVFAKPVDPDDALRMLGALQGRTHQVLTAVGLAWMGRRSGAMSSAASPAGAPSQTLGVMTAFALSESQVTFAALSASQMQAYVQTGEPFGKAGGYAIQGLAARFISKLSGSYSGVMGLPLYETAQLLAQADPLQALIE